MAQRVRVDGFQSDAPVAPLSEFARVLQKWVPELDQNGADKLLVSPPFELPRQFSDGEAAAVADELGRLGARIRVEPIEDPTWWREREGDTLFLDRSPEQAGEKRPSHAHTDAALAPVHDEPGFWEIWTEVVFHPSRFFASPLVAQGGASPLLFAIVVSIVGAVLASPGNYVLGGRFAGETSLVTELLTAVVATPFITVFFLFFFAVVLHMAAKVLGGKGEFGIAWRIAAYSSAVNVFQAIPVIGHALILLLFFSYSVAGLQGGYRLTPTRAAAAALLPGFGLVLLFALLALGFILLIGAAGLTSFLDALQTNPSPQF